MSDMTPEQARAELSIIAHPDDPGRFAEVGIRALETLAADTIEYGVEINGVGGWAPVSIDPWGQYFTMDKATARETVLDLEHEYRKEYRIVARRVSEPWEVRE